MAQKGIQRLGELIHGLPGGVFIRNVYPTRNIGPLSGNFFDDGLHLILERCWGSMLPAFRRGRHKPLAGCHREIDKSYSGRTR